MSRETRRNTLKGLVFTVPAAWSAPLVQSVLLPVHAQTSPTDENEDDCNVDLENLVCSEPGSIFVESNRGPACDETVTSNQRLQATFAFNPPASNVPMVGVVLCNGQVTETNCFNSNEGLGTNVTPDREGCTSGTITMRLVRLDNGCSAECNWTVSNSE